MWETQQPSWSSDLANEPHFRRAAAAELDGVRSGIFVPIVAATGMIGIVELTDDRQRGLDSEAHRGLRTIADELGRHLAERLRRETETIQRERLQLAMSGGRMGMWTFHIPTGQVSWDATLEQVHGIAAGTFGGTFEAFASLIHHDDRQAASTWSRWRCTNDVPSTSCTGPSPTDGSIRWIKGRGAPVFDRSGELQIMTGIGMDVTDEVLDRELLRRRATSAALAADVGRALVSDAAIEIAARPRGRCAGRPPRPRVRPSLDARRGRRHARAAVRVPGCTAISTAITDEFAVGSSRSGGSPRTAGPTSPTTS